MTSCSIIFRSEDINGMHKLCTKYLWKNLLKKSSFSVWWISVFWRFHLKLSVRKIDRNTNSQILQTVAQIRTKYALNISSKFRLQFRSAQLGRGSLAKRYVWCGQLSLRPRKFFFKKVFQGSWFYSRNSWIFDHTALFSIEKHTAQGKFIWKWP